jgi:hypothetical protein
MIRRIDSRWILVPAVMLLAAALIVLGRQGMNRTPSGAVLQAGDSAFDPIRTDEIQTILPEDAIPAMVNPAYGAATATRDIRDNEAVIGLSINGDARAFPIVTLSAHEIVDDVIGGRAVAVTW